MKKPLKVAKTCYETSVHKLNTEANSAELATIRTVYERFDGRVKTINGESVAAANDAREIGLHLRLLSRKDQLSFIFWKTHLEGNLPFSYEHAKAFVSLSHKLPEPAKTIQDVAHLHAQMLLADGALQLPERAESQSPATVSLFARFLAQMSLMQVPFKKLIRERALKEWAKPALKKLRGELRWAVEADASAAKLLGEV